MKESDGFNQYPVDMSKVSFDPKYRWGNVLTPGFKHRLTPPPASEPAMNPSRSNPTFTDAESFEYLPTHDLEGAAAFDQRRRLVDNMAENYFHKLLNEAHVAGATGTETDTPCKCKTGTGKILRVVLPLLIVTIIAVALGYFVAKHEGK